MVRSAKEALLLDFHHTAFTAGSERSSQLDEGHSMLLDYLQASMLFNLRTMKYDMYSPAFDNIHVSNYRRHRRRRWLYILLHPQCLQKPYLYNHLQQRRRQMQN